MVLEDLVNSQRFGMEINKVLIDKKSQYQDIKLLESVNFGKVLVLDGVIQITEKDYFTYNESGSYSLIWQ